MTAQTEILDSTTAKETGVRVRHASFARMGPMAHTGSLRAACHCLVIEQGERVILVDSGFGVREMRDPLATVGADAITLLALLVSEEFTALRTLARWNVQPEQVTDIVLTHLDNDHAGGLHDFPHAKVHVTREELDAYDSTRLRGPYRPYQVSHQTSFVTYGPTTDSWFGLESRKVDVLPELDLRLVPLPGHTLGHAGVAYRDGGQWALHAGDCYFDRKIHLQGQYVVDLPIELIFQTDSEARRRSIREVRRLFRDHANEIDIFCTHDQSELEAHGGDTTAAFANGK